MIFFLYIKNLSVINIFLFIFFSFFEGMMLPLKKYKGKGLFKKTKKEIEALKAKQKENPSTER